MAGLRFARLMAPLALVGCAVALYVVVDRSLGPDAESSATPNRAGQSTAADGDGDRDGKSRKTRRRRKTYVVKSGESISIIAVKTGVSLAQIEELNPDLDPRTLSPGTRLKLRP